MNDSELVDKFVGYLESLEATVESAGDFVASEAPLVVQEYLALYWWQSLFGLCLCVTISIFVLALCAAWFRFIGSTFDADNMELVGARVGGVGITVAVLIMPIGFAVENANSLLKVSVAPRVVVLEKVQEIMR